MAICTKCGMIINDADADKHICNPADIPAKGKVKKPTTTEVSV